jgi:hypothetical protein
VFYYKERYNKSDPKYKVIITSDRYFFCTGKWQILPRALLVVASIDHRGCESLDAVGSSVKGLDTW